MAQATVAVPAVPRRRRSAARAASEVRAIEAAQQHARTPSPAFASLHKHPQLARIADVMPHASPAVEYCGPEHLLKDDAHSAVCELLAAIDKAEHIHLSDAEVEGVIDAFKLSSKVQAHSQGPRCRDTPLGHASPPTPFCKRSCAYRTSKRPVTTAGRQLSLKCSTHPQWRALSCHSPPTQTQKGALTGAAVQGAVFLLHGAKNPPSVACRAVKKARKAGDPAQQGEEAEEDDTRAPEDRNPPTPPVEAADPAAPPQEHQESAPAAPPQEHQESAPAATDAAEVADEAAAVDATTPQTQDLVLLAAVKVCTGSEGLTARVPMLLSHYGLY
jgi:hypothetical protein